MFAWVAVADQFLGSRVQILLADLDAFSKCGRCRLIENLDAAARSACNLNSIEPRTGLWAPVTDGPHLTRRERIPLDRFIAMQLGCGHKLLDTLRTEREAEMRVPELAFETRSEERRVGKECKCRW